MRTPDREAVVAYVRSLHAALTTTVAVNLHSNNGQLDGKKGAKAPALSMVAAQLEPSSISILSESYLV